MLEYSPSSLADLYKSIDTLRSDYLARIKKKFLPSDPERLATIGRVEELVAHFKKAALPAPEIYELCFAATVFGLEEVDIQYKRMNPKRSTLYCLFEEIQHSDKIPLSHVEKLSSLNKIYYYLESHSHEMDGIDIEFMQLQLKKMYHFILGKIAEDIFSILNSISCEEKLIHEMESLLDRYLDKKLQQSQTFPKKYLPQFFSKPNESKIFLSQLIAAISQITFPNAELHDETLTIAQKAKHGILFFSILSTKNCHWFRSPKNSCQYNLLLEIVEIEDIKLESIYDCMAALNMVLNDTSKLIEIEQYGLKNYSTNNKLFNLHKKLMPIRTELNTMLEANQSSWFTPGPLALILSTIFAWPGYALGTVGGYCAAKTQTAVPSVTLLSNILNKVGCTAMGVSHGYFGFLAADFIVQWTLMRAFAQALEKVGSLAGKGVGMSIEVGFKLSKKGFKTICRDLLGQLSKEHNAIIFKNVNAELINELMRLPGFCFDETKKEQIEQRIKEINFLPEQKQHCEKRAYRH